MLSILTAVVSDNMITSTNASEQEFLLAFHDEERQIRELALKKLFKEIDRNGDGNLSKEDIVAFSRDRKNALFCAKLCRVPVRDICEVMYAISGNDDEFQRIDIDSFTEPMLDIGNQVTEKSSLRLGAHIVKIAEKCKAISK